MAELKNHKILSDTDKFTISPDNELYYDGKKLKTESKLSLELWVNIAVFLSGLGATLSAMIAWSTLSFAKDQSKKIPKIDVHDTVDVNLLSAPDLVKVEQHAPTITIVCPSGEQKYNLPTANNDIAVVCEGAQTSNMNERNCIRSEDSDSLWICR